MIAQKVRWDIRARPRSNVRIRRAALFCFGTNRCRGARLRGGVLGPASQGWRRHREHRRHSFWHRLGFIFYLFFKSRYIPRGLSALGLFASVIWTSLYFGNLIFPEQHTLFQSICLPPMALADVLTGLYLMLFALKTEVRDRDKALAHQGTVGDASNR